MKEILLKNLDGKHSVLDELKNNNIYINADCNGMGTCGKCKVIINGRSVLACETFLSGDVSVGLSDSDDNIKVESGISVITSGEVKTAAGETAEAVCIDIGTTTVAAVRIDAITGKILESATSVNHQRCYGSDVISRIRASSDGKSQELKKLISDDLSNLLSQIHYNGSAEIIISGNTTMEHLLLGYPCHSLGVAPYTPVNISLQTFDNVTLLPGISTYVGADIVSGICALGMDKNDEITAMIDLGTNGEMAVGNRDKILVASTAAGPAFEGGNISHGCAGIPGAICKVKINGLLKAEINTIDNMPPAGICGSGVIDTVSQLVSCGLVDKTGLLNDEFFDSGYPVSDGIFFTQKDIREVQMAKSAIRAGLETLAGEYGISVGDISTLYLAGGFGTKIDVENACRIGLVPGTLSKRTTASGNTSLAGAVSFAANREAKSRMISIAENSREVVLASNKTFNNLYLKYMCFEL